MQHHFRYAAVEKNLDGSEPSWSVRQNIHQPRRLPIDARPIFDGWSRKLRGVRNRGNVQQQIRASAERRVRNHRIVNRILSQDVVHCNMLRFHFDERTRRTSRQIEPDGLSRWRECGMCNRKTQRFGDDLARCRRAEELTAAAGRRARAASQFRRFFECDQSVREACAKRLNFAGVFALLWQQRNAAGNNHTRQRCLRRERHHHRG